MNIWFPIIQWRLLPRILAIAGLGTIIAGTYGIIHDQITYAISEEYFTKLKFSQFDYADPGQNPRLFVTRIGFLATWWVGFFSAWFLARIAVPALPFRKALQQSMLGCLVIFICSSSAALIGYSLSLLHDDDYSSWTLCEDLNVVDTPAFVQVAYIHNAGYLGALIGLIISLITARRLINRSSTQDPLPRDEESESR